MGAMTLEQQKALAQMFGNARYIYNWGLDLCIKARESGEKKSAGKWKRRATAANCGKASGKAQRSYCITTMRLAVL